MRPTNGCSESNFARGPLIRRWWLLMPQVGCAVKQEQWRELSFILLLNKSTLLSVDIMNIKRNARFIRRPFRLVIQKYLYAIDD